MRLLGIGLLTLCLILPSIPANATNDPSGDVEARLLVGFGRAGPPLAPLCQHDGVDITSVAVEREGSMLLVRFAVVDVGAAASCRTGLDAQELDVRRAFSLRLADRDEGSVTMRHSPPHCVLEAGFAEAWGSAPGTCVQTSWGVEMRFPLEIDGTDREDGRSVELDLSGRTFRQNLAIAEARGTLPGHDLEVDFHDRAAPASVTL